jgi:hypothetical protein
LKTAWVLCQSKATLNPAGIGTQHIVRHVCDLETVVPLDNDLVVRVEPAVVRIDAGYAEAGLAKSISTARPEVTTRMRTILQRVAYIDDDKYLRTNGGKNHGWL